MTELKIAVFCISLSIIILCMSLAVIMFVKNRKTEKRLESGFYSEMEKTNVLSKLYDFNHYMRMAILALMGIMCIIDTALLVTAFIGN